MRIYTSLIGEQLASFVIIALHERAETQAILTANVPLSPADAYYHQSWESVDVPGLLGSGQRCHSKPVY
jgi:hypothetical protein